MAQPLKILVIDDEPTVRRFLRVCLERNGYQVRDAESGEEALAIYVQEELNIQLVICDVHMSGVDGNEVARRIHQLKPTQRILFVTASPGNVGDHVCETLAKPFSATQLLGKVARQMVHSTSA